MSELRQRPVRGNSDASAAPAPAGSAAAAAPPPVDAPKKSSGCPIQVKSGESVCERHTGPRWHGSQGMVTTHHAKLAGSHSGMHQLTATIPVVNGSSRTERARDCCHAGGLCSITPSWRRPPATPISPWLSIEKHPAKAAGAQKAE